MGWVSDNVMRSTGGGLMGRIEGGNGGGERLEGDWRMSGANKEEGCEVAHCWCAIVYS